MPSNLYESKNEFRLYDVEGVILSPNEYILINEPEGFRDFNITIERDPDKHGLFYEFGGDDELLGFDRVTLSGQSYSPYEFINTILDSKGIDSKIQLEFLSDDISQYKADFDFESLNIEDYKISVNVRRVLLGDLFRTRIETPVDFSKTESIDGDTITGLSSETMFLHGKEIFYDNLASSSGTNFIPFTSDSDDYILQFDLSTPLLEKEVVTDGIFTKVVTNDISINQITRNFSSPVNTLLYSVDTPLDNLDFKSSGALSYTYNANYSVSFLNFAASTITHDGTFISIDGLETRIYTGQSYSFNTTPDGADVSFKASGQLNIPLGKFSIYDRWVIPRTLGINQQYNIYFKNTIDLLENLDDSHYLDLKFESYFNGSTCESYNLFDSTNHILESITNQTSVLESSFLSSNASDIYQTNGYNIRKFDSNDSNVNTSVKTDFKSQFDKFLQPIFGLGYSIYENNNTFKLLIERYDNFYQDNEIDYIDTVQDGTYFVEYDKELIYNEVKIGYKDFPKSTDENKSNNLDEFNTDHNYLTPIESVKNKKEYISEAIASGYKIENQRREQFKDVPSDTVSDDDKMFVINGLSSNSYESVSVSFFSNVSNKIYIFATYLDIQSGDVLNFPDSQNTGRFTVESVSILGDQLIIIVSESFTIEIVNTRVVRNTTRLRALRDEEFDFSTNIIDPETSYNIGLNPRYMLKNQSLILNSGFNPKPINSEIKAQEIKLNDQFTCKFKSGEGDYNLDNETTVTMGENQPLSTFNNYQKLFTGFLIKFTANINYQRLLSIRNDYLNQGSNNFGYIRIKTPLGTEKKGFLMSMNYNPLSEQAEFVLREKFE